MFISKEEKRMSDFSHYKWRVIPEALRGLHAEFGADEDFSSAVIAPRASRLGRRNSELTARQIGNVLSTLQKKGLVQVRVVREENCRKKMWSFSESGRRVTDWRAYWREN
jgi:hypothetical protein